MAIIVTRAGKGSPLTHAEMDANLVNLNTDHTDFESALASTTVTNGASLVGINDTESKFTGATVEAALQETRTEAELSASSGSSLVGHILAETGAVSRTVGAKLQDMISVKDFGAVGDGTTDDTAAFVAALASGAMNVYVPYTANEYIITGALSIPRGVTLHGDALDQPGILCKTSVAGDIVFFSMTGYTQMENLRIYGDSSTSGTLVSATGGTYTFTGHIRLRGVRLHTAKVGLFINSIFDAHFTECEFRSCKRGVDASPLTDGGDNGYINTVSFNQCYWLANADYDFYANPATRISVLAFNDCGFDPGPTIAKVYIFAGNPVTFKDCYFEGGPTVPAVHGKLTTMGFEGCYLISTKGWLMDATAAGNLFIERCRVTTTDIIDCSSFLHLVRLTDVSLPASGNVFNASNQTSRYFDNAVVNGTTYDVRRAASTTHVPVLSGANTPGTPTYTFQSFRHTVIGNQCHFVGRVSISAVGGMVGSVQISLPFTAQNISGLAWVVSVGATGVTLSGGRTQLYGQITNNTNQLSLLQMGSGLSEINLDSSGLAATTTIKFSGVYEIA